MENYESVDFLKECMEEKRLCGDCKSTMMMSGLGRMKFIFDGTDMYVVSTRGIWNADNKPGCAFLAETQRMKYTGKRMVLL